MLHLEHASAEINTAIAEGFYVHMLPPAVTYSLVSTIHDDTGRIIDYEMDIDARLQYEIVPRDDKRTKRVDHRDALSKQRHGADYQPPGGFAG